MTLAKEGLSGMLEQSLSDEFPSGRHERDKRSIACFHARLVLAFCHSVVTEHLSGRDEHLSTDDAEMT